MELDGEMFQELLCKPIQGCCLVFGLLFARLFLCLLGEWRFAS